MRYKGGSSGPWGSQDGQTRRYPGTEGSRSSGGILYGFLPLGPCAAKGTGLEINGILRFTPFDYVKVVVLSVG